VPLTDGYGALQYAAREGAIQTVQLLRKHYVPFKQDIKDRQGKVRGNTLICAAIAGNAGLFRMAWEDGAKDFVSDYGWSLAHFAVEVLSNGVRDLLLSYKSIGHRIQQPLLSA
jgi:ankyrin repeat protein